MSTIEPTKQYEDRGVNTYAQELLKQIGERDDTIAQLRAERDTALANAKALGLALDLAGSERDALARERDKFREALELARHHFIRSHATNLDELKTMPTPYDYALKGETK